MVIDDQGNLLALRDDGATVYVHQRREATSSWAEWFVTVHRGTRCSWAASNSTLYLLLGNTKPYAVDCAALPDVGGIRSVTERRVVFSLPYDSESDLLIWSGTAGVAGFVVTQESVRQVFCVPGVMAFDADLSSTKLTLFGMVQREIGDARADYAVRKRGRAARVVVDMQAGRVDVLPDRQTKKFTRAAIEMATQEKLPSWWSSDPQVEYWLGRIGGPKRFAALGVVDDVRVTDEAMGLYPVASDAMGLGVYPLHDDSVADGPSPYYHKLYCLSLLQVGGAAVAYVQSHDKRARLEDLSLLSIGQDGAPELKALSVDWGDFAPPVGRVIPSFKVFDCGAIGIVGVVYFLRKGSQSAVQALMRSKDGVTWKLLHEIREDSHIGS
ncbi:MAG TPA: hypothetical protein VNU71_16865 [Burkholderiaceae bacterium]|nr:hypothetical protein [Burkholderiaceae bacterium]